jgi:hypothetical protein
MKLGAELDLNDETRTVTVVGLDANGDMAKAGYLLGDVILDEDAFRDIDAGRAPQVAKPVKVLRADQTIYLTLLSDEVDSDFMDGAAIEAEDTPEQTEPTFADLIEVSIPTHGPVTPSVDRASADQSTEHQSNLGPQEPAANVSGMRSHLGLGPQNPRVIAELQQRPRRRGSYFFDYDPYREPIWSDE